MITRNAAVFRSATECATCGGSINVYRWHFAKADRSGDGEAEIRVNGQSVEQLAEELDVESEDTDYETDRFGVEVENDDTAIEAGGEETEVETGETDIEQDDEELDVETNDVAIESDGEGVDVEGNG